MTVASHVKELQRKHQDLSDQVERAHQSPAADTLALAQMKKQKLALKEQISRLQNA